MADQVRGAYQVPRMDALESRAWLALVGLGELLPAALDARLQAEAGLTHYEFGVLTVLRQAPGGAVRMKALAAATTATRPRLSKVVARLVTRGLVERVAGADDGRAVEVRLTPDGRRALIRAVPDHIAHARELVIDRLSRDELEALADILEPIVRRLDPLQRLGRSGECATEP